MTNIYLEEIEKLDEIKTQYNSIYNNQNFLEYDDVYNLTQNLLSKKLKFKLKNIFLIISYKKYYTKYNELSQVIANAKSDIDKHNNQVFLKEKENFTNICGLVEGKNLDDQQIDAIVRKNKNQLVIAAAGAGKTTTIIGKVKYLLLTKQCMPQDILLLSFTNASAAEMKERIKKETTLNLDVMTFHKLGLEIIKNSSNSNYKIFDKDVSQIVKKAINVGIENNNYLNKLINFISNERFNIKDEFDFTNEEEYKEYLKYNKPTTLKGEIVKSYGELEIANYLFKNGIEYIYEKEYEYITITDDFQQYKPDFYLPEYKIYIEYFGIDENNDVPSYFKSKNNLTAKETYNESINWKRNLHKNNNTIMIETFYYENKQGKLIQKLESQLKKYNVRFEQKSNLEIWNIINKNNNGIINELSNVFSTIINLIKSNNYTLEEIENIPSVEIAKINKCTFELVKPIYLYYQNYLNINEMIDFNDMINLAINNVEKNSFIHNYKYVIVDEYQDISNSRYKLLKTMRNQKEYKLFCVGDDWQSIYRFNGSDIDLITNFENYWGNTFISFIARTYRYSSNISKLSGNFIMKNPQQIRKNVIARESKDLAIKFINSSTESKCINILENNIVYFDKNSNVLFLGRYSYDIEILKKNPNFVLKYNTHENVTEIIYKKRRDLKIRFMTIHKSKGLQADYVVLLNNKKYGMGFPSKINDLPFINLLLANKSDIYPFSEERRLFYVALTRAKKQTVLLTQSNNKSIFIEELESDYKKLIITNNQTYKCPKCGGKLVLKQGPYGKFIGCKNYPRCKFKK